MLNTIRFKYDTLNRFAIILTICAFMLTPIFGGNASTVKVLKSDAGFRLNVDGEDFMINGMNWDYFPIGTNYSYSLWNQSDDVIKAALDAEMGLLKNMGINVIRQYTGAQPKWIKYIYENYGIYTMLNHSFGRYGLTIDGAWTPVTDYRNPATQELLMSEVIKMVNEYKNTPGLLMFLLGNENNYGLFWAGAETEDFPDDEEEKKFIGEKRGRPMYKLMNDAALKMKSIDSSHPVAICNGDLLFAEIVAEECKDVDIYGVNMYRGVSFGDAFERVKNELDKPIMFTEFGADAFNAVTNSEDQKMQAYYMVGNWKEIYENAAGLGKAGNSIGGFTFQFSDGWWKYGQTKNLEVHDNNASWANGGYSIDQVEKTDNNMNEEWFGICAKGPTNERGLYTLYPRAAYYALKDAHNLNPYEENVTSEVVQDHFDEINLMDAVLKARGDKASLSGGASSKVRVSGMRLELETFLTGGDKVATPEDKIIGGTMKPAFQGFDHLQSAYVTVEAKPAANASGSITFNVLGNVPENTIDEIFYENRGLTKTVLTKDTPLNVSDIERLRIYSAQISWEHNLFSLDGFYRTGHYHWGYEGDFFGLYPESNYGPNIDIYNGNAPFGVEMTGKKFLNGFKLAYGPELWWGANPAYLVKYQRHIKGMDLTGIFQNDISEQSNAVSSFAVPVPPTKKVTLQLETKRGPFTIELGGIWSGSTKIDDKFQVVEGESGDYQVLQDSVRSSDALGAKFKVSLSAGRLNWYMQGATMGIVADGGPTSALTFTGWRLKDTGMGNQNNFITGFTYNLGSNLQIGPNFLWQKPIIGPIPNDVQAPGRKRNILSDPFAVRANRETIAGELMVTYDPTPGTWMYDWDNDRQEDAKFAASLNLVYRNHKTTQDAAIGILANGRTMFAFPGSPPAQDLWEFNGRFVSKISPDFKVITNLFAGTGEPNGDDTRLIERFGGDFRVIQGSMKYVASVKVNDWGPYDYHKDYNLTYPLQVIADISTVLGTPQVWDLPQTKLGIRFNYRTLDKYSPRYCPDKVLDATGTMVCDPEIPGFDNGNEWEIQTYLHINI